MWCVSLMAAELMQLTRYFFFLSLSPLLLLLFPFFQWQSTGPDVYTRNKRPEINMMASLCLTVHISICLFHNPIRKTPSTQPSYPFLRWFCVGSICSSSPSLWLFVFRFDLILFCCCSRMGWASFLCCVLLDLVGRWFNSSKNWVFFFWLFFFLIFF